MILIGYSGHSYVINGILHSLGLTPTGYCDKEEKDFNPFSLNYYNKETSEEGLKALSNEKFFIAIGNNRARQRIYNSLAEKNLFPVNVIHPSAIIDDTADIGDHGIMISAGVIINPLAAIGTGAICNTGCIIEHECVIGDFAHVGPGAVLCGNVYVGANSFVGATLL